MRALFVSLLSGLLSRTLGIEILVNRTRTLALSCPSERSAAVGCVRCVCHEQVCFRGVFGRSGRFTVYAFVVRVAVSILEAQVFVGAANSVGSCGAQVRVE